MRELGSEVDLRSMLICSHPQSKGQTEVTCWWRAEKLGFVQVNVWLVEIAELGIHCQMSKNPTQTYINLLP